VQMKFVNKPIGEKEVLSQHSVYFCEISDKWQKVFRFS
jgi:hypothetical protein